MGGYAVLTGAAGDLGRATALRLAADGWDLLLADHPGRSAPLEATGDACSALGVAVTCAPFDVTDHLEVGDVLERHAQEHGPPGAVVANAGVQGDFAPIHAYDPDAVAPLLAVNVVGVFHTVAAAARTMIAGGDPGAVVVTASMAGVSGAPNMPAYSASKAAVIGLVKSAAKDLAPYGIRVNAVSPAFIGPGAMWEAQVARQAAAGSQYYSRDAATVATQMIDQVPLRRYGSPEEVGDVIAFLVGRGSSYLTGTNIEVSGGSA